MSTSAYIFGPNCIAKHRLSMHLSHVPLHVTNKCPIKTHAQGIFLYIIVIIITCVSHKLIYRPRLYRPHTIVLHKVRLHGCYGHRFMDVLIDLKASRRSISGGIHRSNSWHTLIWTGQEHQVIGDFEAVEGLLSVQTRCFPCSWCFHRVVQGPHFGLDMI